MPTIGSYYTVITLKYYLVEYTFHLRLKFVIFDIKDQRNEEKRMFSLIKNKNTSLANSLLFFKTQNTHSPIHKASSLPCWILSETVKKLWLKGHKRHALDIHYEDLVRKKTGGTSQYIGVYEIDAITSQALIQCKRSPNAQKKPKQFIKDNRAQINRTIIFANERGLNAEFWFEQPPASYVVKYIQNKGGFVKIGLDEKDNVATFIGRSLP